VLAKDWAGLEELYTTDAMLLPPNAEAVKGTPAIATWFASTGLNIKEFTTVSEDISGQGSQASNPARREVAHHD
jgi:ketosteroid isomerase-like protein